MLLLTPLFIIHQSTNYR